MWRKALTILSGNAVSSLLLLIRNLLVARLIPVADYGIAATLGIVMTMVEMSSTLGLQQQIVQAKEGNQPRFQAVLQGFQLLRGMIAGAALFALATPFARLMGVPEVAWAYRVLALAPVLNALVHFDIYRLNRQLRFGPMILTKVAPAVLTLALVWPLVHWFGDWRVMLWVFLVQSASSAAVSHLLAERRWRLALDRAIMAQALRFGWPILGGAILLFLIFQGDKVVVGRAYGMETLAIFSMGMTLTLAPAQVLAASARNLFLPRLAPAAGTPRFEILSQQTLQAVALAALLLVLGVVLLGGPLLHLLLGPRYAPLAALLPWFAVIEALYLLKNGPSTVALAIGRTGNAMAADLVRVSGLPVAWIAASHGSSLLAILQIILLAEGLGLAVAFGLILHQTALPTRRVVLQQLAMVAVMLAIAGWGWHFTSGTGVPPWPVWLAGGLGLGAALAALPEARRQLRRIRIR